MNSYGDLCYTKVNNTNLLVQLQPTWIKTFRTRVVWQNTREMTKKGRKIGNKHWNHCWSPTISANSSHWWLSAQKREPSKCTDSWVRVTTTFVEYSVFNIRWNLTINHIFMIESYLKNREWSRKNGKIHGMFAIVINLKRFRPVTADNWNVKK